MKKINRLSFLRQSLHASAFVAITPLVKRIGTSGKTGAANEAVLKDDIVQRLLKANDAQVPRLLKSMQTEPFARRIGYDFAVLSASFYSKDSAYYQSPEIVVALERIADVLLKNQAADGTVSIGNLESPPDTAFILEPLCAATWLLTEMKFSSLSNLLAKMKTFIVNSGAALASGGVHTPNHRWVICAALSRINKLYPDKKYTARIEDWLGEGVFNDSDGHYPERSGIYAGVENEAFLTIGRLLNKPQLFNSVRKNLDSTYYYMEPGGDLVTTDSRRQDQYLGKTIISYYPYYRYLAILDKNGKFAAIAKQIEGFEGFEEGILNDSLFH